MGSLNLMNLSENDLIGLDDRHRAARIFDFNFEALEAFLNESAALKAATLPTEFILIGDSRAGNSYVSGSNDSAYDASRSPLEWFYAYTNARVQFYHFDTDGSQAGEGSAVGVGGQRSKDFMERFKKDVLDKVNARTCVVFVGYTNDLTQNNDADTMLYNASFMSRLVTGKGGMVWHFNIDPRNDDDGNGLDASQEAVRKEFNRRLPEVLDDPRITIIDVDAILSDENGLLASEFATDGLHWNSNGANKIAVDGLVPAYVAAGGKAWHQRVIPGDYDATVKPFGNVLDNSAFTGTGGITSTAVTGTISDLWRCERSSGTVGSAVASIVPQVNRNGDIVNFQRFAINSDGAGADNVTFRFRPTTTYVNEAANVNDWFQASVEMKINEGADEGLLRAVYFEIRDEDGTTDTFVRAFNSRYNDGGNGNKDTYPSGEQHILLETPPIQVDGTTGFTVYMYMDIDGTIAGDVTVDWAQPILTPLPFFPANDYLSRLRLENDAGEPKTVRMVGTTLTVGDAHD